MTKQTNLYYQNPDCLRQASTIIAVRQHPCGVAIAMDKNIARAGGGGEPADKGHVTLDSCQSKLRINNVEKQDGLTWIIARPESSRPATGALATVDIDTAHRNRRRRLHTAVHMCLRTALEHFGSFQVSVADIDEDARYASIRSNTCQAVTDMDLSKIDRTMRTVVLQSRPVTAVNAKSLDRARGQHGNLLRVSERYALTGRIRLICIEDYDVNPCSGLHHATTNIGPYQLIRDAGGREPAEFAVKISLTQSWMYWFG